MATRSTVFFKILTTTLTDEILTQSIDGSPYSVCRSTDGYIMLEFATDCIPASLYVLGLTPLSYSEAKVELELPAWSPSNTDEVDNSKSLQFDGVNEYVDIGTVIQYVPDEAFSWSIWVKPDNATSKMGLISRVSTDPTRKGFNFHMHSSGEIKIQWYSVISDMTRTCVTELTAGVWQHLVVTFSGNSNKSGFTLYLDGVDDGTIFSSQTLGDTFTGQGNGVIGTVAEEFNEGLIAQVSYYDIELTQSDIDDIYNSGTPTDVKGLASATNLQHHWNMSDSVTFPTVNDIVGSNDGTAINMEVEDYSVDVP